MANLPLLSLLFLLFEPRHSLSLSVDMGVEAPKSFHEEGIQDERLVSNGTLDFRGRQANKQRTGGWKASPFIIVNEVAERLAFFSIAVSMVSYLVFEMHESIPTAATLVNDWVGAAYVLTLLGAFLSDAYLGRFLTVILFSCIYAVGMVMLTLSASLSGLRPPACAGLGPGCDPPTSAQSGFLYAALGLIALGTGGIKPCVSSFGADQFDENDKSEMTRKYSFFNWFFFAINMGALMGITVMVYVQVTKGWVFGFAVPTALVVLSVVTLALGAPLYRFQKPTGSAFSRFLQVLVASVRNHLRGIVIKEDTILYEVETPVSAIPGVQKLPHTRQYRFLDKAAVSRSGEEQRRSSNKWNLCTVTQVEELKSLVRVLPIWASTIALSLSFSQLSTFFIVQGRTMDRSLPNSSLIIPPGSVPIFSSANAIILVPLYEGVVVPFLRKRTGHKRGITSLQRMGVGLFLSIFALLSAAVIEKKRVQNAIEEGIVDSRLKTSTMSVFWLLPQFFLLGSAEVFTYVGQLEFFYDEATDGTRSLSSALFLSEFGIGSWLSTALVTIIQRCTGGEKSGWFRNNLNASRLDLFYWVLAGINVVNFVVYVVVALRYKGTNVDSSRSVVDESIMFPKESKVKDEDEKEMKAVI
ncbi:protein NRT1/ PTR FAMILY 8.3-like isoform X1 [Amborella trichopoda]|nr:protein NRT1/ PTR FAMILY 8.3-like isoform X1 [Amborella trichopoda]|eukprot:XP_020517922.1 protein NRT1/ PTR FAMILY 8.3-like isoform X1 [Amborella trichopoda]